MSDNQMTPRQNEKTMKATPFQYYKMSFRNYSGNIGVKTEGFYDHRNEKNSDGKVYTSFVHFDEQDGNWIIYKFKRFTIEHNCITNQFTVMSHCSGISHKVKAWILRQIFNRWINKEG